MSNILRQRIIKTIMTVIMVVIGIAMLLPLFWMFSASFKLEKDVFKYPIEWIPSQITYQNYVDVTSNWPYFTWYYNTLKVTALSVLLGLFACTMAGYALARMRFKGRNVILLIFIATLMFPIEVRLLPDFIIFKALGLYNTHAALILPSLFQGFMIFLFRQYFMGIPYELTEAARIDGCGEFRTFYQVILPLAKPAIVSVTIISFVWGWNSYQRPLIFINDVDKQLLSVGISLFREEYNDNVATQMAGASMAIIPVIIVYLIAQKYFVDGIATTGLKG
ncbi:MAG: carbohydrate ABC transporter permease [Clostridiaceae bacterium]|nr:carbohydrate ABC transporter permease [Clostridiaceae bacterium]